MANASTLLEFATKNILIELLVKERTKCRRRNRNEKIKRLDRECDIDSLKARKMLSRMMPPRHTWVRPSKRLKLANGAADTSKNAEKALLMTIRRDRKREREGHTFAYLQELEAFITRIQHRLSKGNYTLETPQLMPTIKSSTILDNGGWDIVCRPIAYYPRLEDKIILSLTTRFLRNKLDRHLHENILSFRPARYFLNGEKPHVTDNNDAIELIKRFREQKAQEDIYVADCDIRKFFDIIPHHVVLDSFQRLLDKTDLTDEGKTQVMMVLKAYLDSYDFYTNAWEESISRPKSFFAKVRRSRKDPQHKNNYRIEWIDEILDLPEQERRKRGVPQGGALSTLIANVVLNDVDQVIVTQKDDNRLFIRYCDDMILMHTDRAECERLMRAYTTSLTEHGFYYHDFESVHESKDLESPELTTKVFWKGKSHHPFKWSDGAGDCNRYVGFLGYEVRRNGSLRLRKSTVLRFKDKFRYAFYSIRSYKRNAKFTEEEKINHEKKTLDQLTAGVNFYKALNLERFTHGQQYRFINKLREMTKRRLDKLNKQ